MNRIVLIGNGFDLAHGMKTSYQDFIDDYWENAIKNIASSNQRSETTYECDYFIIYKCFRYKFTELTYKGFKETISKQNARLIFKNKFLEIISNSKLNHNWVDIENEYYDLLKATYRNKFPKLYLSIDNLNKDLEEIKNKLKEYLQRQVEEFRIENRLRDNIGYKIYEIFKVRDFSEASKSKLVEIEFNKIKNDIEALKNGLIGMEDIEESPLKYNLISKLDFNTPKESIKKFLESPLAAKYFDLNPKNTLLLNFNYTSTHTHYRNPDNFIDSIHRKEVNNPLEINIHGTIDNDIIFGFGDELDEDYKEIEKLHDNNYLENIKSINYLETDNYKRLLEFIYSGSYQIYIMGHSGGTSDRTLLNTLFEHDNCTSIKLFYHKREGGSDNYSDIIRNISRHFNDKAKMRDRVVNKEFCEPLVLT